MNDTRFKMPSEPKNGLDLFRWLIFEPVLLRRFSERLTKKESLLWFLRAYPWIALFCCLLWIASIFTVVVFDIPSHFPEEFEADFIEQWQQHPTILSQIYLLSTEAIFMLGFALVSFGILFGIFSTGELRFGIVLGLVFGSIFGLILSIGFIGSGVGLGLGSGLGFSGWLTVSPGLGLISGLGFGLIGFFLGFGSGIIGGLGFVSTFWIMYFRLIFYPVHVLRSRSLVTFEQNPYLKDGLIWLPLWPVKRKLLLLAKQQPEIAFDFANFLLEYRPLQKKLAMRILHAVRKNESENMNNYRDSKTQSEESELK